MSIDAFMATQEAFAELSSQPETPEASPTSEESTQDTSSSTSSQSATDAQATDSTASSATESNQSPEQATPAGSTDQKPKGPIPFDRHEAVLANTRKEYEEKLARLAWAEQVQGDPTQIAEELRAMRIAATDPDAFVSFLKSKPAYARYFQPAAPEQKSAAQEDLMPKPDKLYDDGSTGYSAERLQQLLDWKDRQNERKMAERFGPIEQEYRGREVYNQALARTAPILENARNTWDGFKDHEPEIRNVIASALERGEIVSLDAAYRQVVVPKLKAQESDLRARIRQELIEESNRKSAAVTEVPGGPVAKPAPKSVRGMQMSDVVAEVYKELSGG